MSIHSNSRYASGRLFAYTDDRNNLGDVDIPTVYTRDLVSTDRISTIYMVQHGDRLDTIAARFAGSSSLWWIIADVNNIYGFPLDLEVGTELKIPSVLFMRRYASGGG